ncbi:bacterial regulatory s, tetR family protein [Acinetobacter sp. 1130196]|uniref:TetR/AcrR family transcriptional regulator n=1 Tax=Acinetobacter calcoaceticus/baumannii complex TaxID=909768 RepID=UPI00044E751A|nr:MULTISPECIES: TetR/AcrR family transcriptional regulator [Acinetobacter calcoaceticus/baumannii complex]EKU6036973.1 TetR/AcrR family transcriptional regulator [Acinetobacter nosocomialis]EXE76898.1 bacterial regulatory s, tetR family protein [Acinetobacter sp. 1566109]EXR18047.1 bacterial regulatory s, tetR family protein [Acinetobacter sp. 1130196]MBJ9961892.1 TetR/AcrR family transcriptional regulator [Acinetobacter nosocomialis]MBP1478947.1 TetR/AcrR family transcriptional regulator [Ac
MPPLVLSTRALKVVNHAIHLFHHHGFHLVGVDRIIKESEITKMTFYHHFQSKARFIEICILVQKERLQDQVIAMFEYDHSTSVTNKLKTLYDVHTDLEGLYYLLFKAIFETKNTYSNAYQVALKYRTWITNEIYSQLRLLKADASFHDAKLLLHIIEGTIIQRLSHNDVDERDKQFEYFIAMFL